MMKRWLMVLLLGLGMAAGAQAADVLADIHADMAGCESCHADGEPSSDGAYENETCVGCHGGMTEIEGDQHAAHDGMLVCSDCHAVHEHTAAADASGACADCHDDK
ncbi:cytochrome c3 family protein [Ferrimonas marina]|uniref:Cytochrome c3 n=1 Tax=Ferrimonas marina TaxID=299255 RepID=A0A1M5R9R5_9GAMM|nr:cytochrome c3 family protein [Ferrimonas marina]SHH22766.1 Cytochrome c3 [Ferrimonas marina]